MTTRGRGSTRGLQRARGAPVRGASGTKDIDSAQSNCLLNAVRLEADFSKFAEFTVEVKYDHEDGDNFRNVKNLTELQSKALTYLQKSITERIAQQAGGRSNVAYDEGAILYVQSSVKMEPFEFQLELSNSCIHVRVRANAQRSEQSAETNKQFTLQQVMLNAVAELMGSIGGYTERSKGLKHVIPADGETPLVILSRNTINRSYDEGAQDKQYSRALESLRGNEGLPALDIYRAFDISCASIGEELTMTVSPLSRIRIPKDINFIEFLKLDCPILVPKNRKARGSPEDVREILRCQLEIFKGLEVVRDVARYTGETQTRLATFGRVRGISDRNARDFVFKDREGVEMTVEKYFEKRQGITLKHPNLPLVEVQFRGTKADPMPMELIVIKAQSLRTNGTSLQALSTNLFRLQPGEVRRLASVFAQELFTTAASRAVLDAWGVRPANGEALPSLLSVPLIRMASPDILYHDSVKALVRANSWNLIDRKLYDPLSVPKGKKVLAIDLATDDPAEFGKFLSHMTRSFSKVGLDFSYVESAGLKNTIIPLFGREDYTELRRIRTKDRGEVVRASVLKLVRSRVADLLAKAKKTGPYKEVLLGAFVVVGDEPHWNESVYFPLKMLFEGEEELPTQMARASKVPYLGQRPTDQNKADMYFSKLALGINTKFMDHLNHLVVSSAFKGFGDKTLFLGSDLAHGWTRTTDMPRCSCSVAGMVGSLGGNFHRYQHAVTLQGRVHDIIQDPTRCFSSLLGRFERGSIVEDIVYFRDGVDYGSHREVLDVEVAAIESCLKERGVTNPRISVICLMKRHGIRMLPLANPNDGACVPAGSATGFNVMQRESSQPSFFLLAHAAIGASTAVPCRCVVLRNDHGLSTLQWAEVLNAASLMNQVVTLGVSLATPSYYAHKLCERSFGMLDSLVRPIESYGLSWLEKAIVSQIHNAPAHTYL